MKESILVAPECREKAALLLALARSLCRDLEIDTESPQRVIPCDLIDEEAGEALLSVYLKSPPETTEELIIAVDPGEARVGLALATGDGLLYASSTTPRVFLKVLHTLHRHYKRLVVLSGRAPAARKLLQGMPAGVTVELLDESSLPSPRSIGRAKGDASDAVRIYLGGRALVVKKALSGASP